MGLLPTPSRGHFLYPQRFGSGDFISTEVESPSTQISDNETLVSFVDDLGVEANGYY